MITKRVTHLYPLYLPESRIPRADGVHVSAVLRCIATEAGILKPEWADELSLCDVRKITDPTAILRINIGLAWEEHYIPMLPEVTDHPEPLLLDGIYGSMDGESISSVIITPGIQLVVHEVKCTYKSTKTVADLESQWLWVAQIKAYCKASGTRYARLHVLFLCGDYHFPIRPVLEVWEIEFTQAEIDDNWNLITQYRDERLAKDQAEDQAA